MFNLTLLKIEIVNVCIHFILGELWATYRVKLHGALLTSIYTIASIPGDIFYGQANGTFLTLNAKSTNTLKGSCTINTNVIAPYNTNVVYTFPTVSTGNTYRIVLQCSLASLSTTTIDTNNTANVTFNVPTYSLPSSTPVLNVNYITQGGQSPNLNVFTCDVQIVKSTAKFAVGVQALSALLLDWFITITQVDSAADLTLT